jgi:hypothetical protein
MKMEEYEQQLDKKRKRAWQHMNDDSSEDDYLEDDE